MSKSKWIPEGYSKDSNISLSNFLPSLRRSALYKGINKILKELSLKIEDSQTVNIMNLMVTFVIKEKSGQSEEEKTALKELIIINFGNESEVLISMVDQLIEEESERFDIWAEFLSLDLREADKVFNKYIDDLTKVRSCDEKYPTHNEETIPPTAPSIQGTGSIEILGKKALLERFLEIRKDCSFLDLPKTSFSIRSRVSNFSEEKQERLTNSILISIANDYLKENSRS